MGAENNIQSCLPYTTPHLPYTNLKKSRTEKTGYWACVVETTCKENSAVLVNAEK